MKIINSIFLYFKSNRMIFFTVIIVFFLGVTAGGYLLTMLPEEDVSVIKDYTDKFFSAVVLNSTDNNAIFRQNFIDNLKLISLIWISGFFVFLIPVSLIQIFLKGFRTGFAISYFIGIYSVKGAVYSFINYFSGNFLLLPLIVFFTVHCIKHSAKSTKSVRKRIFALNNIIMYAACVFAGLLLSLFDGYIMSFVLKVVATVNL